ncbi:hypothetical protein P4U99_22955 [Brevibacillus agri]|uniref:hypothetical protein n=1 Tax=Brevibacillus TaxID=55080 RepID=UPI001490236E|nr:MULTISPECIES: hypothetical protein [Brevibacillus]MBE5394520.1 hypothetical protein [Brevibacillus borstelensis]MCM3593467.1 hypothetical protein [Brevibacillus borstelensis]MED1646011.1 hypothetical protein [Brevibacillus agri]MED1656324.1 hypothetical protein [Brevibacillus agri]MED1689246.1 hypothetical protein [Brevibacillus agri]
MTGMRHPDLKLLFRREYLRFFLLIHVPFYLWLFFTREYPDFLATMDATIILLAVLFSLLIRPLMLNGTIKAYYRKHYRTKTTGSLLSVAYTAIWFGALLRSTLLVGNFIIQYFSFEENDIPALVEGMKMNYIDANGAIAGVTLFFLFLYVIYYKERYISIQQFSYRTMILILQGWSVEEAMRRVLSEREIELAHKYNSMPEIVVERQETKQGSETSQPSTPPVQDNQNQSNVIVFPVTPMRRHARK